MTKETEKRLNLKYRNFLSDLNSFKQFLAYYANRELDDYEYHEIMYKAFLFDNIARFAMLDYYDKDFIRYEEIVNEIKKLSRGG